MSAIAVILYGPPASGKDTITGELGRLDSRYALFLRMKVGIGSTSGYRVAGQEDLERLHAEGQVIYQNERYGSTYVVDRPRLSEMLMAGQIPVLHLGQIAGVRAVMAFPARWVTVLLWCSRQTTGRRARSRGSTDVDARLTAWDETLEDLAEADSSDFLMAIDTDAHSPEEVARMIDSRVGAEAGVRPSGARPT